MSECASWHLNILSLFIKRQSFIANFSKENINWEIPRMRLTLHWFTSRKTNRVGGVTARIHNYLGSGIYPNKLFAMRIRRKYLQIYHLQEPEQTPYSIPTCQSATGSAEPHRPSARAACLEGWVCCRASYCPGPR